MCVCVYARYTRSVSTWEVGGGGGGGGRLSGPIPSHRARAHALLGRVDSEAGGAGGGGGRLEEGAVAADDALAAVEQRREPVSWL